MKSYIKTSSLIDLLPGDILIQYGCFDDPLQTLDSHAAVVSRPIGRLTHITYAGLAWTGIYEHPCQSWIAYRNVMDTSLGSDVGALSRAWVLNNAYSGKSRQQRGPFTYASDSQVVPGILQRSSQIRAAVSLSYFGPVARSYVRYLHEECQEYPPDILTPEGATPLGGGLCSFLPIALYQALLGVEGSEWYMAIDARRTTPRALARYLDGNPYWSYIEILGEQG